MERFQETLKKHAQNAFARHTFLIEWRVFIVLVIMAKLAAMAFSVFAGFFYVREVLQALFGKGVAPAVSIASLVIIEALTAITLFKFFKFAFRFNLKAALLPFILALGLFSASFYFSTNGLALRQSTQVDNRGQLDSLYSSSVAAIEAEYEEGIDRTEENISVLLNNPQGWTGGKRTHLTTYQLKKMDEYYKDLKKLREGRPRALAIEKDKYIASLELNNKASSYEADKYYRIATLIMLCILGVNGLLMFFYSRISEDGGKGYAEATNEVLSTFTEEIQNKTVALIEGSIQDTIHSYFGESAKAPVKQRGPKCKQCGESLGTDKAFSNFCSDNCRKAFWVKVKKR